MPSFSSSSSHSKLNILLKAFHSSKFFMSRSHGAPSVLIYGLALGIASTGYVQAQTTETTETPKEAAQVIRCGNPDQAQHPDCPKPTQKKKRAGTSTGSNAASGARGNSATSVPVSPSFTRQDLVMYAGEAVVIDVGSIDRVAIGNGKVASTTVLDKNRLLIIAQEVGDTNILLWDKTHLIREVKLRVTAQNLGRVMSEARNLLASVPGLSINNVGDRIFIEGKDLSEQDQGRVKALAAQYPGIVDRTSGRYQAAKIADPSSMVMFDLYFVEFKKSYLQNLGVNWQRSFDGFNIGVYGETTSGPLVLRPNLQDRFEPPLPPNRINGVSTAANVAISLPGVINLAVDSGDAIVLAAPKISSRSGGKARFTAGGEVPLPSVSQQGTNVEFKSYGILLEVEPQVNGDGSISGMVRAEVSSLDPAVSVMGIPAFLTRRTEADFFSHNGEAVVLSGLYSQELSKATDKVPLVGDVPLLGALFSNNSEIRRNSELVVFIVPHLHSASGEMNRRILNNTRAMVDEQSRKLNGDGKDILPKLKATSELWGRDLLGNERLGRDPAFMTPPTEPVRPPAVGGSDSPFPNTN